MDEARERFLRAIVERIPAERIAELHLFPPLRQGGRETGVAVVAAWPDEQFVQAELPPPVGVPEDEPALPPAPEPHAVVAEAVAEPPEADATEEYWEPEAEDASEGEDEAVGAAPARLIVYRAGYRWTLKGVDRGKWEVDVRAEADAPLEAVGDVVRGVHRRAGGEAEPERLSGDAVRAALSDRPWAATT